MKEFVIKMSDEDYEYFLRRAEMIVENFKEADSQALLSPEQTVELAIRNHLLSHIGKNLLEFLAESENKLKKAQLKRE